MEQILEAALGLTGFQDRLQGRVSQSLHRGKSEPDLPVSRGREIQGRFVDVWPQHVNAPLPAVLHVLGHVVRPS